MGNVRMRSRGKLVWLALFVATTWGLSTGRAVAGDHVILNDLIVDGSACIGFDCVDGESFGFDTIRLKENNLRIKFQDTSNSASFPTNDWQLTANDSTNGGADKFSIDDIDGGRTPLTIEAVARSHSLYVRNNGHLGLGTNSPSQHLHIKHGDSPTVRLEQDGSYGWAPQTWDLAGNEANFFIRDVTTGSKLPFRIRPGAPTSSIDVAASGDVGIGTASPDTDTGIHVKTTGMVLPTFESSDDNAVQMRLKSDSTNRRIVALDGSDEIECQIHFLDNGAFRFLGPTDIQAKIDTNGDFTATGTVFANNGADSLPDYVFEPDYDLMPITEVAEFVAREKHLPNVPSADEVKAQGRIDVVQLQLKLLEKVEELTLYTIEQQHTIDDLKARLEKAEHAGRKAP